MIKKIFLLTIITFIFSNTSAVIINLDSEEQFSSIIKHNKYVIVDFYAEWCSACTQIHSVLLDTEKKYPSILFLQINIAQYANLVPKELRAIPSLYFFKDGKQIPIYGIDPKQKNKYVLYIQGKVEKNTLEKIIELNYFSL